MSACVAFVRGTRESLTMKLLSKSTRNCFDEDRPPIVEVWHVSNHADLIHSRARGVAYLVVV